MSVELLARVLKDESRRRELQRCQDSLYYLCSEVLDYKWNPAKQQGMTEAFHGPMCYRYDKNVDHPRLFTASHRGSLKTSVFTIGGTIQDILRDPNCTTLIPHAVDDEAVKIVAEITNHFRQNDKLRKLEPSIMPAPNGKWWFGAGRMTVRGRKFSRQPTVMGVGAGTEITGAHVDVIRPDDIIGRRTIENSELPKIKSWWQNTALNVLNPAGKVRAVGTRWHIDDIWAHFIASAGWNCLVRSCSETSDGAPDYTLQNPVHFGPEPGGREKAIARLERAREEMGADFNSQMMNDPSPASEKPWDKETCEHLVDRKYLEGAGIMHMIIDPAPAKFGSLDASGAKARADGTKDYTAIAVCKKRRNGDRRESIWVDGAQSRDWDLDEILRNACQMMRKWNCRRVSIEAVGAPGSLYTQRLRIIAREEGVKYSPVELETTYKGKQFRFGALVARAKADEFLICETVPEEAREVFLAQAREWRNLETGRNGLRYDDMADVVSYFVDPALEQYAESEKMQEWSPYKSAVDADEVQGSRYVRW